jgi:hypothetical protein
MQAAPLELASKTAVMAIGGFSGSDPAPTLAQFQAYVAGGEVRYFVPGGRGGGLVILPGTTSGAAAPSGGFGDRGNSAISTWVAAHFKKLTVGTETVYDLQQQQQPLAS